MGHLRLLVIHKVYDFLFGAHECTIIGLILGMSVGLAGTKFVLFF